VSYKTSIMLLIVKSGKRLVGDAEKKNNLIMHNDDFPNSTCPGNVLLYIKQNN